MGQNEQWASVTSGVSGQVTRAGEIREPGSRGTLLSATAAPQPGNGATLDVTIWSSSDGVVWTNAGSFSTVTTAPSVERKSFAIGKYQKASWVVTHGDAGAFAFTLGDS